MSATLSFPVKFGPPTELKRPVYALRFRDGLDFGVVDEFDYFEDHGHALYFFDKTGYVRAIAPMESLNVFRVIDKPADAIKASNAEAVHIQKEIAGAGIKEESKESMRAIAEKEAERFVLKIEEGTRAFIIDNERPTDTWKLDLSGLAGANALAGELVALANKAHRDAKMATHMDKMTGQVQVHIGITDLETAPSIRLSKPEFDKYQAQGIYKGVMAPAIQMANGEFFRLTIEEGDNPWVSLTRAFVETRAEAKPVLPAIATEIEIATSSRTPPEPTQSLVSAISTAASPQ